MRKTIFTFLLFVSTLLFGQRNKEALLLSYSSLNGHYVSLLFSIENTNAKLEGTYSFLILPEKKENKQGNFTSNGKLFFLQKDTLKYAYFEENYSLKRFNTLDSMLAFKDTFYFNQNKPTSEQLKAGLEKEKIKNSWDEQTFNDALEMAELDYSAYDNSGVEIDCIFYPYITLRSWNSNSGGAHPNWNESIRTYALDELFSPSSKESNLQFSSERTTLIAFECCSGTDSLLTLLRDKSIKGDFIDSFDGDLPDSAYMLGETFATYSVIERVKGEPHCKLRADVFADYAHSGDYTLTAEVDMGCIDKYHVKKLNYEISSPSGNYGLNLHLDTLSIFNKDQKIIYKHTLASPFERTISEEWAEGKTIDLWWKALNRK